MKQNLSTMVAVAAVLLHIFATCCCGDEEFQIAGGVPIDQRDYLWFCAIGNKDFLCGGSLISRRHVLTADHCLRDHVMNDLFVRVGYFCPRSDNCGRQFHTRHVMEVRRNPSFGDVAILVLSLKVPSSFGSVVPDVGSPSYLSRVELGGEMIMVGAGRNGSTGDVAKTAATLKIQLQHTKYRRCRKAIKNKELRNAIVSKSTICSVSDEGKPCQGDSGSAIIVDNSRVGNVLVAVHSYGPRDCNSVDDNLFGHVAVSAVSEFVISVVCDGSLKDKKEKWCPTSSPTSPPHTNLVLPENCCNEETCAAFINSESHSPPPATSVVVLEKDSLRATLRHNLTAHTGSVYSVAFDATSSRLASTSSDRSVMVWDPNTGGSPLKTLQHGDPTPWGLAFSPAGTILAVEDGNDVALYDVTSASAATTPYKRLTASNAEEVSWHPDGHLLACADRGDRSVIVWNADSGDIHHTFQGHRGDTLSVSFDPQGRYLASSDSVGDIKVWDVSSLTHVLTIEGHTDLVWSVAFNPDGTRLASGSNDNTVRVWRASDGSSLGVVSVGSNVRSVAWSSDGHFLVSGSSDGVVRVWDADSVAEGALLELIDHSNLVYGVAWSSNGKWIASASWDKTVKIWEVSSN